LIARLAIEIGMALALPNRSPRIAGPTKGTAGAAAASAVSALMFIGRRKAHRHSSKTAPYNPMMDTHNAMTNGIS
jgi:hypothetical protein